MISHPIIFLQCTIWSMLGCVECGWILIRGRLRCSHESQLRWCSNNVDTIVTRRSGGGGVCLFWDICQPTKGPTILPAESEITQTNAPTPTPTTIKPTTPTNTPTRKPIKPTRKPRPTTQPTNNPPAETTLTLTSTTRKPTRRPTSRRPPTRRPTTRRPGVLQVGRQFQQWARAIFCLKIFFCQFCSYQKSS